MATRGRTVRVYTVAYDGIDGFAQGDARLAAEAMGTSVYRTRREADAHDFARTARHYGEPARVHASDVPRDRARRWGLA